MVSETCGVEEGVADKANEIGESSPCSCLYPYPYPYPFPYPALGPFRELESDLYRSCSYTYPSLPRRSHQNLYPFLSRAPYTHTLPQRPYHRIVPRTLDRNSYPHQTGYYPSHGQTIFPSFSRAKGFSGAKRGYQRVELAGLSRLVQARQSVLPPGWQTRQYVIERDSSRH